MGRRRASRATTTGRRRSDTTKRGYDEWVRDLVGRGALDRREDDRRTSRETYNGEDGPEKLLEQGYEPAMVEAMHGAGVQAIKMRGGMPLLGVGRVFGFYRFANMLALLDRKLRPDVPPEEIVGSRAFDNYAWHTDLPPGHPMVTGSQTVDFDLFAAEHSKLLVLIGMNWICTKMPDAPLDRRRPPQGHTRRRDLAPTTCRRRTRRTRS